MSSKSQRKPYFVSRVLVILGGAAFLSILVLVIVALTTHPFNTPFHHEFGQMLHALVWQASGRAVGKEWDTYSGVVRFWDNRGRLSMRQEFLDGKRHGVWIDYDQRGAIERVHEYRNGEPWNGVCNSVHMKAFQAEYRDGRLWNGASFCVRDDGVEQAIDGQPVTEAAFAEHYGILDPDDTWARLGAPVFTKQQRVAPVGVSLPFD